MTPQKIADLITENHTRIDTMSHEEVSALISKAFPYLGANSIIYAVPPVELEALADSMTETERREVAERLEGIAERAASYSAYFEERNGYGCGDQGHKKGVKAFNSVLKKVRRAFGYSLTHDLNF